VFNRETYAPRRHRGWWIVSAVVALFVLFVVAVPTSDEEEAARPVATVSSVAAPATDDPNLRGEGWRPSKPISVAATPRRVATPAPRRATPAPTADPADVFELWYLSQGYPAEAYPNALDFIANGCRSLRGGATQEELFVAIMISAEPEYWDMFARILGAGVSTFCPDQSHKIG